MEEPYVGGWPLAFAAMPPSMDGAGVTGSSTVV